MKPYCSSAFIGSFPHLKPEQITNRLLESSASFPLWPQLPNRSFFESMYVQYSENIPAIKLDLNERKIVFSSLDGLENELEKFYENSLTENYDYFAISPEYAQGLYYFRDLADIIKKNKPIAIKGHITGPISFALTVTDENRKAAYFDPSLREIVSIAVKMKSIWQINFLKQIYDDVIFFIDEPYLSGVGSGIFAIEQKEIQNELTDFVSVLKQVHPQVPIAFHCCGNTDWSVLINSNIDILSFDAFNYADSIFYYENELRGFLNKGGMLAWGIVPTSGDFREQTKDSIIKKMNSNLELLESKGFDILKTMENSFITPACGTGSLTENEAEHVIELTAEVSEHFKQHCKFT